MTAPTFTGRDKLRAYYAILAETYRRGMLVPKSADVAPLLGVPAGKIAVFTTHLKKAGLIHTTRKMHKGQTRSVVTAVRPWSDAPWKAEAPRDIFPEYRQSDEEVGE